MEAGEESGASGCTTEPDEEGVIGDVALGGEEDIVDVLDIFPEEAQIEEPCMGWGIPE